MSLKNDPGRRNSCATRDHSVIEGFLESFRHRVPDSLGVAPLFPSVEVCRTALSTSSESELGSEARNSGGPVSAPEVVGSPEATDYICSCTADVDRLPTLGVLYVASCLDVVVQLARAFQSGARRLKSHAPNNAGGPG